VTDLETIPLDWQKGIIVPIHWICAQYW
jgi:hypothetical protein